MRERQVGQIGFVLRLDFLEAKDIRLLLLHQRLHNIIEHASLLLTIFNLSRHGTDAVYVKTDELHCLVYCLIISMEILWRMLHQFLMG